VAKNNKLFPSLDEMPSNLNSLLKWGEGQLTAAGIDSYRLDAKILLTAFLSVDDVLIYSRPDFAVSPEDILSYREAIARRSRREPLAYIIGKKEFWNHPLTVNRHTLIPRPETEILVETALGYISSMNGNIKLLDIGTGSGNIPISLASEIPSLHCTAVDISAEALETARFNSKALNLEGRISFLKADLRNLPFSNLENGGLFDIIVSNPPYIRSADIGALMPEVALFEPRLALDGGADGLVSYRQIIEGCQAILRPEGVLIMETGMGQAMDIIGFINSLAIFGEAEIINDLAGIERVVAVKRLPA